MSNRCDQLHALGWLLLLVQKQVVEILYEPLTEDVRVVPIEREETCLAPLLEMLNASVVICAHSWTNRRLLEKAAIAVSNGIENPVKGSHLLETLLHGNARRA